jgi:hypothetical protein
MFTCHEDKDLTMEKMVRKFHFVDLPPTKNQLTCCPIAVTAMKAIT